MSRSLRLGLLLLGAALVALMIWKAGPRDLWEGLRGSLWVAVALVPLWVAVYVLNAIAWRQLTSAGGEPIPLLHAFRMTVIAFAVNYSTPFLSFGGEPLKVVAATPALGRRRAVGSIVAFRLLHALAHVILFLLALVPAVMGILRQLDSDIPAYQWQTLEQAVDRALWRQRLQGQVIGLFAFLAMILATIGIYGVISYSVAQRTREVGVRVALGASRSQVVGLVLRQGGALVAAGVVLGLAIAFGATRLLTNLLYGIAPTDLVTFAGVPLVLGAVAVIASWVPARRASRIDPLVAMRAD